MNTLVKDELEKSNYNQKRVDTLFITNNELEKKLEILQKELKIHQVRPINQSENRYNCPIR